MKDIVQLEKLSALQIWAKLQETLMQRKERFSWLDFYEKRLESEKKKYNDCKKRQNQLQVALEETATPEELDELLRWSL